MDKLTETNEADDIAVMRPFLDKSHVERFSNLSGTKKGRDKIVNEFPHKFITKFNKRYLTRFDGTAQELFRIMKNKGAPNLCFVISENTEIDGKTLPLEGVIHKVFAYDMGTFVLCQPGKLAYFEGEDIGEHWILEIL